MAVTVYGDIAAKVILPQDQAQPKPRTLRVKMLSKREIRAWQEKHVAAVVIEDVVARDAAYDALLADTVVGWENMDPALGEFTVAGISEAFTLPEFMELFNLIPSAMVLTADDLKK